MLSISNINPESWNCFIEDLKQIISINEIYTTKWPNLVNDTEKGHCFLSAEYKAHLKYELEAFRIS